MDNKHAIEKMHLNNLKDIEIKRLNIYQEQIKLEKKILEKLNINSTFNQNQQPIPINPNQQNFFNGYIPMNNQFNYNYNYQGQMPVPMMPPQTNPNFIPNGNNSLNNSMDSMNNSISLNNENCKDTPSDNTQFGLNPETNKEN